MSFRTIDIDGDQVLFAAGGPFSGILVNKHVTSSPGLYPLTTKNLNNSVFTEIEYNVSCNFSLWLRNNKTGDLQQVSLL